MVDWLVYFVATVVVGTLLAFVIGMFKIGPGKPEFSFGKLLAACLVLVGVGPFAYVEGLSRMKRPALDPAIHAWFQRDGSIDGKLVGEKVLMCSATSATVLLIGQERSTWGGWDRPIVRLRLGRENGRWAAKEATVLRSFRLDKDEFIFPPYQ